MQQRILVVDDDPALRELLTGYLTSNGFSVQAVGDGVAMRAALAGNFPDAIVLDLMLPGEDGLALTRGIRSQSNVPILMLSARGEEVDRVIGLEVGADDYLAKPFGPRELLARLRALLRRSLAPPAGTRMLRFGRWQLDRWTRQLQPPDGAPVQLSQAECRLLQTFLEHPGSVLARDELMDLARGRSIDAFERSIDLLVSRLRAKLADDPREPRFIRTVRGVGYLFEQFGVERPATLLPRYQDDTAA